MGCLSLEIKPWRRRSSSEDSGKGTWYPCNRAPPCHGLGLQPLALDLGLTLQSLRFLPGFSSATLGPLYIACTNSLLLWAPAQHHGLDPCKRQQHQHKLSTGCMNGIIQACAESWSSQHWACVNYSLQAFLACITWHKHRWRDIQFLKHICKNGMVTFSETIFPVGFCCCCDAVKIVLLRTLNFSNSAAGSRIYRTSSGGGARHMTMSVGLTAGWWFLTGSQRNRSWCSHPSLASRSLKCSATWITPRRIALGSACMPVPHRHLNKSWGRSL